MTTVPHSRRALLAAGWTLGALAALPAGTATAAARPGGVYADYADLIGEWDVGPDGEPAMAVDRFRWGPQKSYIWLSVAMLGDGEEQPHMEGMLLWNGVRGDLDMLMVMDLNGGRVQEQGRLTIRPDGSFVREITAIYSPGVGMVGQTGPSRDGGTLRFEQVFRRLGPDRYFTSMMRQTAEGWTPTFPGSASLVMIRRT